MKQESPLAGFAMCIMTAIVVSVPGVALWFGFFQIVFRIFYSASAFPFFVVLVLGGGNLAFFLLRERFFGPPYRVRSSILWACRYLFVGGALGFLMIVLVRGSVSTPYATTFYGGILGLVCGSLGGAWYGWRADRENGRIDKPLNTADHT